MPEVVAIKRELRCKICRDQRRAEIDALLLRRSQSEKDADGNRINLEYVKAKMAEWGIPNPTDENVKTHWRKHCEIVGDGTTEAQETAATAVVDAFRGGDTSGVLVNPDEALDLIITQGMAEMDARVRVDGKAGITVDHVMKAIEVKTRRKQDDGINKVLRELGAGIGNAVLRKAGAAAALPAPQPDLDLADSEVAEVDG